MVGGGLGRTPFIAKTIKPFLPKQDLLSYVEAILRLYPRPAHSATVLAPFRTLDEVMHAVPRIVASGIGPLILEYIDMLTMAAATASLAILDSARGRDRQADGGAQGQERTGTGPEPAGNH